MLKLIFLFYYVGCFGYACMAVRKNWENRLIKLIFFIFFPFLGIALAFYIFRKQGAASIMEKEAGSSVRTEQPEAFQAVKSLDIESEINFVPIKDALILNDHTIKRKLLIHSLKGNTVENPALLKLALQDQDSETSHYAATSIMEMKRKYQNTLQIISGELKEQPENIDLRLAYVEALKQSLNSRFLDEGTDQQYRKLLSANLESILQQKKGSIQQFTDKINCDIELRNYDDAAYHSKLFLEMYPLEEKAYTTAMKLQYVLRNRLELQELIRTLKKQPVSLSADALNTIRYWSQEDQRESGI